MSDQELRIIAPTAIVGYGFQESSLERMLEKDPHLIACDGGSTDPGPNYLGMGKAFVGRDAAKRDLELMFVFCVLRIGPDIFQCGYRIISKWSRIAKCDQDGCPNIIQALFPKIGCLLQFLYKPAPFQRVTR